jgi:hypothetical protein
VGKLTDDWGKPIGADEERLPDSPVPLRKPRRDSLTGLVYFFRDSLPQQSKFALNAPVNGPALTKGFKKLIAQGYTHEQIREMIRLYVSDLVRKPLPEGITPWRGFLANLDGLSSRIKRSTGHNDYGDISTDRRFKRATPSDDPPSS